MRAAEITSKLLKNLKNTKQTQENNKLSTCLSAGSCRQLILQGIKIAYSVFTRPRPRAEEDSYINNSKCKALTFSI